MRRFYLEKIEMNNNMCLVKGGEAKHMIKVLRMKRGEHFILMDGTGACFEATVGTVSPAHVQVFLEKPFPPQPPSPINISLCQALPRSRVMDYLVQKTSELGVDVIAPFYSERGIVRYEEKRVMNKMRHWREIAISAAKQCGRTIPADIRKPLSFDEMVFLWDREAALKLVLWEQESSRDLKQVLRSLPSARKVICMIGPEGGFSDGEIMVAGNAGFISVSLGKRILRVETAAIALVTLVQYELGDLNLLSHT